MPEESFYLLGLDSRNYFHILSVRTDIQHVHASVIKCYNTGPLVPGHQFPLPGPLS